MDLLILYGLITLWIIVEFVSMEFEAKRERRDEEDEESRVRKN